MDYDYELKSWPWFFDEMVAGRKKHDMRDKRERDYTVGDLILLREYDPRGLGYTGRTASMVITYITSNDTPCAMSSNCGSFPMCVVTESIICLPT